VTRLTARSLLPASAPLARRLLAAVLALTTACGAPLDGGEDTFAPEAPLAQVSSALDTPVEAESFTIADTARAKVISAADASGGQAVRFTSNTSASKSVSSTGAVTGIRVRAQGSDCEGPTQLGLDVNGTRVLTTAVTSAWADYAAAVSVPAGSVSVKVSFINDRNVSGVCDRNLNFDRVTLVSEAGQASGALTISQAVSATDTTLERGQTLSASVTYKNNGTTAVTAKNIVLTSRAPGGTHAGGPFYDLTPRLTNVTLQPGQSVTLQATRSIASTDPTGTWELYPTWEDSASVWRDGAGIAFTVSTGSNTGNPGPWLSGASGNGVDFGSSDFANWRGTPVNFATTWSDNNCAQTGNAQFNSGGRFANWRDKAIYVALGAINRGCDGKENGETWAAAASGAYDARWSSALNSIKSKLAGRNIPTVYLSFAHEMNGYWYGWRVNISNYTHFVTAWKRFYNLKQQIYPEAKLAFVVNHNSVFNDPNRPEQNHAYMAWTRFYPGDAYVDVLGVDYYNTVENVNTLTDWNNAILSQDSAGAPVGLKRHLDFAASHNKPLILPEWGMMKSRPTQVAFITGMRNFLVQYGGTGAGRVEGENYFNVVDTQNIYIYPTSAQPQGAAEYQRLW
jgi:hypothetical protein